jgi:hypothetical protein
MQRKYNLRWQNEEAEFQTFDKALWNWLMSTTGTETAMDSQTSSFTPSWLQGQSGAVFLCINPPRHAAIDSLAEKTPVFTRSAPTQ